VLALGVEDLGELADVELAGVGAGGGADPQPVAATDGQMGRQVAGDRPGDAAAGCAAAAGRAQHLPESLRVAQVVAGGGPVEPGDPGQRLAGGGGEAFLLVLCPAAGVAEDRGGILQSAGEFQELQVVGLGEPADLVEVVFAGDGDDGARRWSLDTDYRPPAFTGGLGAWTPPLPAVLTVGNVLVVAGAGGTVLMRGHADRTAGAVRRRVFYGAA
jgi:hypothetical protein